MLDDSARKIPTYFAEDYGTLPYVAILDGGMRVQLRGGGLDHLEVYAKMDELMSQ